MECCRSGGVEMCVSLVCSSSPFCLTLDPKEHHQKKQQHQKKIGGYERLRWAAQKKNIKENANNKRKTPRHLSEPPHPPSPATPAKEKKRKENSSPPDGLSVSTFVQIHDAYTPLATFGGWQRRSGWRQWTDVSVRCTSDHPTPGGARLAGALFTTPVPPPRDRVG